MASELEVQCGGDSNPLTDTMGNYLPIIHTNAWKQMGTGTFPKIRVPHMRCGLNVVMTSGADDLTRHNHYLAAAVMV